MAFLLSKKGATRSLSERSAIEERKVTVDAAKDEEKSIEGFLWMCFHSRRRRYCVLRGRTLHVYSSKDEASTLQGHLSPESKKKIIVVGAKDACDLDKSTRTQLLGGDVSSTTLENAIIVSTVKSKLVAIEAETRTEKQRWLHAMNCLNFASAATEKSLFEAMLQDKENFDAHTAVTLLHRYRDNPVATELVIDRLAEYAEHHIDDVEFYIQQIMHLVVNLEMTKTDKLVNLLLSICKAKSYVEHLGNCIHLALQLFWLLEAKIEDKDPMTYNLCAKLLMSIEANVVNQQFELPAASSSSPDAVSKMLLKIPGMRERLLEMRKETEALNEAQDKCSSIRPQEGAERRVAEEGHCKGPDGIGSSSIATAIEEKLQRDLLMQWMEKERQKRYRYFHEQRDFVKALTDISEKMRMVEPPAERKKHLPTALGQLKVPSMAYIPLGRVSDPFSRITRVLKDEGTVFSTHSRAPCLFCFEVIEDQVNAAGQRSSFSRPPGPSTRRSTLMTQTSSTSVSSATTCADEDIEISGYIKKLSFKGKYLPIDDQQTQDDDEDDLDIEQVAIDTQQDADAEQATLRALERHLNIDASSTSGQPPAGPCNLEHYDSSLSIDSSRKVTTDNAESEDERSLIRQRSRTSYEYSLCKLMTSGETFGERWREKKERIRKSSPYGQLPGWNVISLISKSNDDIRQEVFAMQLITKFQDIFKESNLPLLLRPYRIMSTGKTSGLIETITDAQSLDSLKKKPGYQSLRIHFERTYGSGDTNSKTFKTAQRNFLNSLVAYSIVSYLLQIKDRHNGNIMLDTEGKLIHIDFGFMLGIAPGGNWSIETAPFKLTKEMVGVLGGVDSKMFGEFVHLFTRGLLAAQRNAEKIITLVEIMMRNSTFPCFQGRDVSKELQKLRDRFMLHATTEQTVKNVMKLISTSYKNKWTKRYDQFQKITNGIL